MSSLTAGLLLAVAVGIATAAPQPKVVVPASFEAKTAAVCASLATSLKRVPKPSPAVARAERGLPYRDTPTQYRLFGNYAMTYTVPAFQRSLAQLSSLGQPATGATAWRRFLANWRAFVTSEVASARRYRTGSSPGPDVNGGLASERMKISAPPAGATRCLRVLFPGG